MKLYQLLIIGIMIGIIAWDYFFAEKRTRITLVALGLLFGLGSIFLLLPNQIQKLEQALQISQFSVLVTYTLLILFIREAALMRVRLSKKNEEITILTRSLAILSAQTIKPSQSTKQEA